MRIRFMELKQKASSTGFRVLYLLDLLLKNALSKNEILTALNNSPNILNATKETVRLDLNTLKSAGFVIENTGKSNGYKYKINWCPIKIKLTKREMRVLENTRNAALSLAGWEYIVSLYGVFKKISNFIEDDEQINELLNFDRFVNIDFHILKELNALTKRKKEIILLYNSPGSGKKEIKIKLKEIRYENNKLYLKGYSELYPDCTVLNVENILKIIKILNTKNDNGEKTPEKAEAKYATCKIKPASKDSFEIKTGEKILKENKDFILLKIKADNEFRLMQRLLNLGTDLDSIEEADIKEKYVNLLKDMKNIYKN